MSGAAAVYTGRGKGKDWIETTLGWTTKIVQHPPKPRSVWLPKGVEPDWDKIMAQLPSPGFHILAEPAVSWSELPPGWARIDA